MRKFKNGMAIIKKFILVFIIAFLIAGTVEKAFTASLVPEIPYTLYVNPSVATSLSSHAGAYILFKYLDYYGRQVEESRRMVSVDLMTGETQFDPTSTIKDVKVIDRGGPTPPDFPTCPLAPSPTLPCEVPWPPGSVGYNGSCITDYHYFAKESQDMCLNNPEWHFSWQGYDNAWNYTKNYYRCKDYGRTGIAVRKINHYWNDRFCSSPWGFGIYAWDWLCFRCYPDGSPLAEFTYDPASDTFTGQLPDGTSVTFYGTPQPQCIDNDGDGHYAFTATCPQGDDCDDTVYDPTVYYGAPEICDGKDNNCDSQVDEGLSTDTDGDGHYTPESCKKPNDDCDDNDPTIYPGAIEICDGKDNNCNGQVEEGCEQCIDNDRDGYYGYNPVSCPQGNDCNDNDPTIYPGATEICDGKDNNCNGQTDERFLLGISCSVGIGECERDGIMICSLDGTGTVCSATPGGPSPEVCDGKDNNCNGIADDLPPRTCYTGPVGTEGVGICKAGTQVCENGTWSTCIGEVTPQEEKCDGKDNNCDGTVDDLCAGLWVPLYKQCASPWGTDCYGYPNAICVTICKEGCALTSAVMVLRYYGVTTGIDVKEVNPRNLNQWLQSQPDGYDGRSVNWAAVSRYSGDRVGFTIVKRRNDELLNKDLCNGRPAILNVPSRRGHFVVATGAMCANNETTWTINDPGRNITTLQGYGNTYHGLRRTRTR